MSEPKYFDVKYLLNMKDKNGETPELFFVVSRVRGAGKTTSIGKTLLNNFFDDGSKFVLFVREAKCLGNYASGLLKGVLDLFYEGWSIEEKTAIKGVFTRIILSRGQDEEKESCEVGYVINIKNVRNVKEVSSEFTDASIGFFDEFQDASGKYLPNEVDKFLDVHTSIARGGGKQRRYFPVIFASNTLSIINPYFLATGLTKHLQPNTKKYRGDGFVYMRFENKDLAQIHADSGMSKAFSGNKTIDYFDDSWLLDNTTGICNNEGWGRSCYIATLVDGNESYSVQYFQYSDIYYFSKKIDQTWPIRYTLSVDGSPNPALKSSLCYRAILKAIEQGKMRFDSIESKRICLEVIC